jgi:hypothetical protein
MERAIGQAHLHDEAALSLPGIHDNMSNGVAAFLRNHSAAIEFADDTLNNHPLRLANSQ